MASFLGTSFENTPVQSAINAPLIQTVLAMKQGQYDANKAKLQAGLDQLASTQVLRPQDQEYIQAKMKDLTTKINDYGSVDMSQSYQADELFNMVKSVAKDPFIQNAIANTKKYQNYNLEVDEIKKKKPELYNNLNYSYGLNQGGVDKYIKGEINDIGSLSYTPFTDISKEFKDIAENLDKYDQEIKKVQPQVDEKGNTVGAYFITQEGKRLTETDLKNKVNSLLSDGAKKQMSINGWGLYDQGSTEQEKLNNVTEAFTKYSDGEIKKAENILAQAKLLSENSPSNEQYKLQVKDTEKYLADLKSNHKEIKDSKNKQQMYTMTYMGDTVNNFASAFAFDNVEENYSVNTVYQNNIDNQYRIETRNIDNAFKEREFQAKYGENGTETLKAGKGQGAVQTKADENFAPKGEEASFYDTQKEYIAGLETLTENESNRIYNQLTADTKKNIDSMVEASKGKMTKTDVLLKLAQDSSELISAADAEKLDKLSLETAFEKQRLLNATNMVREEASSIITSKEMAQSLFSNPNVKILWKGNDGKERAYSAKDVLINNGIIDSKGNVKKSIASIPQVKEAIEKSILVDKILNSTADNPRVTNYESLRILAEKNGEKVDDIVRGGTEFGDVVTFNPNTKTGKLILDSKKNQLYDKTWSNDSFDDLNITDDYNKKISPDEIRKKVGDILAKDEKLAIGKISVVSPKTEAFEKIADLVGDKFEVDRGNSLSIKLIPNQPNMVKISQLQQGNGKNIPSTVKETDLRIEDLPQALLKEVDFYNKKQLITVENLPSIVVPVRYGDINDKSRITDLAQTYFGGNKDIAKQTTKDGVKSNLYSTFSSKLGTVKEPTALGVLINKVVEDPTIHVTFQKGRFKDVYPQVVKKVGNDTTILWTAENSLNNQNIEAAYNIMRYTPQLLVKDYLQQILAGTDNDTTTYIKILEQAYAK